MKPWGAPLARLDRGWVALETYLAVAVIVTEIAVLAIWVILKGLATSYEASGSAIGILVRALVAAIFFGLIGHLIARPKVAISPPSKRHTLFVLGGMAIGVVLGVVLGEVGAAWDANLASWIQNASSLALIGGPRGMVTRLTLWLAMLGASMAASRGKHISIDVATRYFPQALAARVAIAGWLAAALVCFAAAWGFVDSIAVTKFRAPAFRTCEPHEHSESGLCETKAMDRVALTLGGMRRDLFLLGRQISLDFKSLPVVLAGDPYDRHLTPAIWNQWVEESDFEDFYPPEAIQAIKLPEGDSELSKMPLVVEPGTGFGRDLLIRDLNFVLPFGLLMIGLKMLLRILRVLSGEVKVDPDAAHDEEGLSHAHEHDAEIAAAEGTK
jgi:hypothetical protein